MNAFFSAAVVRTLLTPKIKGRSASGLSTHKLMKGSESENDAIINLGLPQKLCKSKRFMGKGDAGVQKNSLSVLKLLQYAPCGDVAEGEG